MSYENAKAYLTRFGMQNKIKNLKESSATVALAALAIGCKPEMIAKSITFMVNNQPIIIVCSGDVKTDNVKFKAEFCTKAKMLSYNEVESLVGHTVGGVCPFGIKREVKTYLDISLKRFEMAYPACGDSNSVVELSVGQLESLAQNYVKYVDVCKPID